jgi:hypothetical protein
MVDTEERDLERAEMVNGNGKTDTLMIRQGNISLILDSYDDIFSDFDPRPYSEKALSDDFLNECKRAASDNREDGFEFRLLIPTAKRNVNEEIVIKKRLKAHFQKHYNREKHDLNEIRLSGWKWIGLGLVIMFLAYLTYSDFITKHEMIKNLILIFSEPGGWFIFWIGGEKIIYGTREKKALHDFYKKMTTAKIYFFEY